MTIRIPGRVVFLVPWPGHWLIGTTDDDYHGPPDRPSADAADVEQILRTVNDTLDVSLGRDDIVGTFAGLRPLAVSGATGPTAKASREHRVTREANGVVRIIGGKYTTYRIMGRDAVDAVLGREAARARPSATAELRLVGAADRPELDRLAADLGRAGFEPDVAARLVDRHGTEAEKVVGLGLAQGLGGRLGPGVDAVEAEVAWAVRREFALSVDDVLARRTRLAQELPDRGAAIAPRVAAILGTALGWDADRQAAEVAAYLEGAERQYGVPELARAPATEPAPAFEAAR
jgi:glycerol-3-phosphate dehydrogenase